MTENWHDVNTDPSLPPEVRRWAAMVLADLEAATPIDRAPDLKELKRQVDVMTSLVREMVRVADDVTNESRNETIAVLQRVYARELQKLEDLGALLQMADRYNESLTKLPDVETIRAVEEAFNEEGEG